MVSAGVLDALWVSMANWAHLGGLLAGLGWAWLLRNTAQSGIGWEDCREYGYSEQGV